MKVILLFFYSKWIILLFCFYFKVKNCSKETSNKVENLRYCTFENNCDQNANCLFDQSKNTYKCVCINGYIGNGIKCYGIYDNFSNK